MDEAVAFMEWKFEFVNGEGNGITLTRDDVEQLLHTLMHHRLVQVHVEVPEMTEPIEHAMYGCGNGVAVNYDGDDHITIELNSDDLFGSRTWPSRREVEAREATKKKGGSK